MSIRRYTATKDNTITNAYKSNLTTRGTGSSMGLADSLEVFSIFGQESSSSLEAARFLVQFPVSSSDTGDTILADRTAGKIPSSGSVNFFLRVFNVATDKTLPRDFTLVTSPVSCSWQEGYGLDMENYSDLTYNGTGSNWINSSAHNPWVMEGGDYLTGSQYSEYNYSQVFANGGEDLEIDITGLVEQWIKGDHSGVGGYENYGVGIFLTGSQEGGNRSYYSKMFSARSSEYFFKRPVIEARWDSSIKDQRGSFYVSSSNLSATDNLNTIYFYNYFRGQLVDLPSPVSTGSIYVDVYDSHKDGTKIATSPENPVTGGWVDTGIYSASFAMSTTEDVVFDRWRGTDTTICYHTGSFKPIRYLSSNIYQTQEYITSVSNLRHEYSRIDGARLRVYTRKKNWNPTIYTVAQAGAENYIIDDIYYKVSRTIDDYAVIPYGTGSLNHTRLSYDVSGSYFDLDISLLESGFEYGIRFCYYIDGSYDEHNHTYKFKVVE
tara:strand:- start:3510 stop:4985 length:1476 start_codon:yes stop_codon:yes gene_type:complete